MRTVELLPGGGDIRVSASNREMYVDLYVEYLLDKSIESQFNAFAKGFHKVSIPFTVESASGSVSDPVSTVSLRCAAATH